MTDKHPYLRSSLESDAMYEGREQIGDSTGKDLVPSNTFYGTHAHSYVQLSDNPSHSRRAKVGEIASAKQDP
jgi:hypothetical protein